MWQELFLVVLLNTFGPAFAADGDLSGFVANGSQLCYRNLCIPSDYDKQEIPARPTNIEINVSGIKLREVNDESFYIKVDLTLALSWTDSRITISSPDSSTFIRRALRKDISDFLWEPDFYIYNLKSGKINSFINDYKGRLVSAGC